MKLRVEPRTPQARQELPHRDHRCRRVKVRRAGSWQLAAGSESVLVGARSENALEDRFQHRDRSRFVEERGRPPFLVDVLESDALRPAGEHHYRQSEMPLAHGSALARLRMPPSRNMKTANAMDQAPTTSIV